MFFYFITKRKALQIWRKGYDEGLTRGYELGQQVAKASAICQGAIISGQPDLTKMEQEIAEILKGKGIVK